MIRGALHIVSPTEGGSETQWDFVAEYRGIPPQPKAAPTPDANKQPDAPVTPAGTAASEQASSVSVKEPEARAQ